MMMSNHLSAENLNPPKHLNSVTLGAEVLKRTIENSHYKIIGSCVWTRGLNVEPGLSIEQFLPDLVVTVSNTPGNNPWKEAELLYENKTILKTYQTAFQKALGFYFDVADTSGQISNQHLNEERMRIVNVIGSPANLYRLPKVTHKPETLFGKLYYSSLADAVSDRTERGELAYMATHPSLLLTGFIGAPLNHWGFELPRLMHITQPSRFRASMVAAMHAADIVTNQFSAHISHFTTNSCGSNCVVANVIYDPKQTRIIWQEVYPNNRNIIPGQSTPFEALDDKDGNGNYIFVIWRQYRGCIKQKGKLSWSSPQVGHPQKR